MQKQRERQKPRERQKQRGRQGNEGEDGSKSNRDSENHKDESDGEEENQFVVRAITVAEYLLLGQSLGGVVGTLPGAGEATRLGAL
ncbi:hypothetical protein MMC22_000944 [Lobaria immixta]|nr:hypothetical protein [Lobaria immixta]